MHTLTLAIVLTNVIIFLNMNNINKNFNEIVDAVNKGWDKGMIEFTSENSTSIVINKNNELLTLEVVAFDNISEFDNNMELTESQKKDFTWFIENEKDLIQLYKNKWIIIKDATIINSLDYLNIADDYAKNNGFSSGSYLIQYCSENHSEFIGSIYKSKK